jgi:nonsense-mediated mRNA decay protein 3
VAAEFCVVCGRTDRVLSHGVCPECFAKRERLVWADGTPTIIVCPTCGARKTGQSWGKPGGNPSLLTAEDLTPRLSVHPEVALRRVRWQEGPGDAAQRTFHGDVDVRFRGTERTVGVDLLVRVQGQTCTDCSRRSGHFFTAIIQVRGMSERLREPPRPLRQRLERAFESILPEMRTQWRQSFSWREELPEGWDYYLSDTQAARAIARFAKRRLDADLKESATLWGRRNGQDVYRVTFRLRIPAAPEPARTPPE